jgi:hypothetical protein
MRLITILGALLISTAANAAPVTIDFENALLGTTEVVDQGFRISGSAFGDETRLGVMDDSGDQFFESYGLVYDAACACSLKLAEVILEREDGAAFAFYSADWSGYSQTSIEGALSDGNSALDPVGTGDWLNVTSVTFSARTIFCTSFCFVSAGLEIDNIVVGAAVPIPAAVWLFGSALGGLGWMRRRKTA